MPKEIRGNLHSNAPVAIILLVSLQLYRSHGSSIYFRSGIIKAHCLYCWSSIRMIHHQRGGFCCLMALLSLHRCLTADPWREFTLNWCSSLCWHLLYLWCCLPPFSNLVRLHLASDTFILLSLNLFRNTSTNVAELLPPNSALNTQAKLRPRFPHRLLMLTDGRFVRFC